MLNVDLTPRFSTRIVQASISVREYGVFKKLCFQFTRTPDACRRRMKAVKTLRFQNHPEICGYAPSFLFTRTVHGRNKT